MKNWICPPWSDRYHWSGSAALCHMKMAVKWHFPVRTSSSCKWGHYTYWREVSNVSWWWVKCWETVISQGMYSLLVTLSQLSVTTTSSELALGITFPLLRSLCWSELRPLNIHVHSMCRPPSVSLDMWSKRQSDDVHMLKYWSLVINHELSMCRFVCSLREGVCAGLRRAMCLFLFVIYHYNYARWLSIHVRDMAEYMWSIQCSMRST